MEHAYREFGKGVWTSLVILWVFYVDRIQKVHQTDWERIGYWMKMIMEEVKESLKRRKWFSILIGLGIMAFLVAVTLLWMSYTHAEEKAERMEFQGLKEYGLSDTLVEEREREFLDDPASLKRLKGFYRNLEEKLGEKYLYIFDQSIELHTGNAKQEEKFLDGYEDGWDVISKVEGSYYPYKAIQMNQQAFDSFSVDVGKGKPFSQKDFIHRSQPDVIPVLLGAEYEKIYQVGDQIKAEYLGKKFQIKVKGFVSPDTFVSNTNHPELYLDRYVVMPAQQFDDPVDDKELGFQQFHYLQIINGSIYSKEDQEVVVDKLEKIKTLSDFPDTHIMGTGDSPFEFLFSAIQQHIQMVIMIAASLFVVCVLSLSILMMTKIQDNYKNMSLHLISGATMNQLFRYVVVEVVAMVAIPGLLVILLYIGIFHVVPLVYILLMTLSVCMMILLAVIPIYLQFRNLPISQLLKRAE